MSAVLEQVAEAISDDSLRPGTPRRRVLLIAYHFAPSNAAGSFRAMRLAKWLPECGWDAVVLSAAVSPRGDNYDAGLLHQVPQETVRYEVPDPVDENWRKSGRSVKSAGAKSPSPTPQPSLPKRLAKHLRDLFTKTPDKQMAWCKQARRLAAAIIEEHSIDAVVSTGPPHSAHLLARQLQRRTGFPWIADFRDPWSRKPWGYKMENPWGQRLLWWFERGCVRSASRVVLNTDALQKDFVDHYRGMVPAERFATVENGFDPDMMGDEHAAATDSIDAPNATSGDGTRERPIRLLHPGSLYNRRDPRPLIAAIARLRENNLHAVFDQVGPVAPQLGLDSERVPRGELPHFTLSDRIPHRDVIARMRAADVLVLLQPDNALQVPSKVFEMLLLRKPILALAADGATAAIVRDYRLGEVAAADDATAIAAAIERLARGTYPDANGWQQAMERFNGRSLVTRFAEVLNAACANNASR